MKKTITRSALLLFLVFSLVANHTQAQSLAAYNFFAYTGTYTPVSGGTSLPAIITDDAVNGASVPIGFNFGFNGSTYTHIWPSSNCWFTLGTSSMAAPTNTYNFQYTAAPGYPVVMPWSTDAFGSTASPQFAEAKYITTGSAPNRIFTIEWLNWAICCTAVQGISVQVRLYEATNSIEFIYRQESTAVSPFTLRIGVAASSSLIKALNNISSSPTIQNNVDFTISPTGRPATGQIYLFTPLSSPNPGGNPVTPIPPLANFDFTMGQDTIWQNTPTTLVNISSGADRNYWDITGFNPTTPTGTWSPVALTRQCNNWGCFIDTLANPVNFRYTFTQPGYYRIRLLCTNAFGTSFIEKPVYVSAPLRKPKAQFFADRRILGVYDQVQLYDLTTNGPSFWQWYMDPPCTNCSGLFFNTFNPTPNTAS
ncbi:MAG: hypothetical protein ACK4Y6_07290, partial [Bacteroidota bacterium]